MEQQEFLREMGLHQVVDRIMETRGGSFYEQLDYESYTTTNVVHVEDMLRQNSADQEIFVRINQDSGYNHTNDQSVFDPIDFQQFMLKDERMFTVFDAGMSAQSFQRVIISQSKI